jgi:hypothetical protein
MKVLFNTLVYTNHDGVWLSDGRKTIVMVDVPDYLETDQIVELYKAIESRTPDRQEFVLSHLILNEKYDKTITFEDTVNNLIQLTLSDENDTEVSI